LLLLEPGEIYFEDFSANLINDNKNNQSSDEKINGQLKMCSKSLVFEVTNNTEMPLIKIQYTDCINIAKWAGSLYMKENNVLAVDCSQYTEIMVNDTIAPYVNKNEKKSFLFNLHYVKVSDYLPQICQLKRASSLNIYEQNSMVSGSVRISTI
jgi:factor associated with neutral sphingomyelinase activation